MIKLNAQPNRNRAFLFSSICLFFVLIMSACENTGFKTEKVTADTTIMKVTLYYQNDCRKVGFSTIPCLLKRSVAIIKSL